MSEPLFVTQEKLEEWVERGEVTFEDNILTLLKHEASYLMAPAAKVTALLDGEDLLALMGKVWKISDLEAKGAEYFHDSIIVGDTAYQCEAGFVGQQQVMAPAVPPPLPQRRPRTKAPEEKAPIELTEEVPPPIPAPRPSTAPPRAATPSVQVSPDPGVGSGQNKSGTGEETSDMDLLTDFLLDNM